jgi:PPOX class probable F420-dependent enzyme
MTDLAAEKFVRLTTFRRDGTPVGTALWVVGHGDHLYVWTGSGTGKVKRVRNNPAVSISPATRRGQPTGPAVPGQATVVAMNDRPQVWPEFTAKYGLGLRMVTATEKLLAALHIGPFRKQGDRVYLELALDNGS